MNVKPLFLGLCGLLVLVTSRPSPAQQFVVPPPFPWYRPGYYAAGYSSVEGYQRGLADVLRSRGQAAESYSRAAINREEARGKYLDNKLKWTQVYWERKRLGEAERAKDNAADRDRRDRWQQATRDRSPEVLPPSVYHPGSGIIEWPEPLQSAEYAELRRAIEEELELRASTGTTANSPKIHSLAREMQEILKTHIRDLSANEYIASRKFLDRLVNQMVLSARSS